MWYRYTMKICKVCLIEKPLDEFVKSPTKSGRGAKCKVCINAVVKEWRENNKEYVAAANRKWRVDNKDYNRERKSAWCKNNRASARKTVQKWRDANRETVRIQNDNHRALKLNAIGTHTEAEWTAMCDYYGHKCLKCEVFVEVLTRDHVIPLSRGGNNCIHNIQPLCRSHNSEKHAKTADYRFGIYAQSGCQCS